MDVPRPDTLFSADPAGAESPPAVEIIGYQLLREIGRGGQAVVYLALQNATARKVAVKIMREGPLADARQRARFEREVQVLAGLNHPNIVSILDRGTSQGIGPQGSQYLVMNYVNGQPLDKYLKDHRSTPSLQSILNLFLKIADAVNAAHLAGVVHRDLKPSNILIDDRGQPHVLDFGLARPSLASPALEDSAPDAERFASVTGVFFGSLPWASPEQAEGQTPYLDARTDVYSLGVILYQMVTGKFPYPVNGSAHEILTHILHTVPGSPSKLARNAKEPGERINAAIGNSKISRQIDHVILMALSKRKEDRYQSAGEMARDISNAVEGLPILAKSPRRRWSPRRWKSVRFASAAIAVCVIMPAVCLVLLIVHLFNHRHQPLVARPLVAPLAPSTVPADLFATPADIVFTTGAQSGEHVLGWPQADVTRSFSLRLQVRINSGTDAVLISKRARNDDGGLSVVVRHDGSLSVVGEASNYRVMLNGSHRVNDGYWHQVLIEKVDTSVRLCVDGAPDVTGVVRESFNSKSPWRLGPAPLGSWQAAWLAASMEADFRNISIQQNFFTSLVIQPETANTKPPVDCRVIDLLGLIDPKRDAIAGNWSQNAQGLVSDQTGHARIRIPYVPPEEYDFCITFSRLAGGQCVTQILSQGEHGFCWQLGGFNSSICGFDRIGNFDLNFAANPTTCINGAGWLLDGQRCTSLIKVRKTGVVAYLDDRLVCNWKTDFGDMQPDPDWEIPARNPAANHALFLGLGSHSSPTIFYSATLVEVTGHGKPIATGGSP